MSVDNSPPVEPQEPASAARHLMRTALKGSLATLDRDTGHPYASLVLVATEPDGAPIFLISKLALHTKNLQKDPRASVLLDGTGELAVFCGAFIGAGLGFLWFNAPPAMVFMGDTGSLSVGGALGAISVVTKHELVLLIIGGLFVLETVSVIVQVASFKLTGKRVFRMAPLHHHYEKKGWAEPTIVIRFWIIASILALAGLATLKLR